VTFAFLDAFAEKSVEVIAIGKFPREGLRFIYSRKPQ
jgi:hypothetical protein